MLIKSVCTRSIWEGWWFYWLPRRKKKLLCLFNLADFEFKPYWFHKFKLLASFDKFCINGMYKLQMKRLEHHWTFWIRRYVQNFQIIRLRDQHMRNFPDASLFWDRWTFFTGDGTSKSLSENTYCRCCTTWTSSCVTGCRLTRRLGSSWHTSASALPCRSAAPSVQRRTARTWSGLSHLADSSRTLSRLRRLSSDLTTRDR